MAELKDCPFCGGKAQLHHLAYSSGVTYAQVKCKDCGAMAKDVPASVEYCAKEVAAAYWNGRAHNG